MKYEADIEKLKEYDDYEFKQLIKFFSKSVIKNLNRSFSLKEGIAENIWQETLEALVENVHKINSNVHLRRWLYFVSNNKAKDLLKKKDYRSLEFRENIDSLNIDSFNDNSGISKESISLFESLKSIINDLPPNYQKMLKMRYEQGYTEKEISDELNVPIGTVKTNISRAKTKIRSKVKNGYVKGNGE